MTRYLEKFWELWESYNGFALVALIAGIFCFTLPWYTKVIMSIIPIPVGDIFLIELFYIDLRTTLFGIIFLLGFMFLIFYCVGVILNNRGDYGTPFETHANSFFKLSVILLIAFEFLTFLHFVFPLNIIDQGWFSFFHNLRHIEGLKINQGFILGIFMICTVITSYVFDQIMLRKHYKNHLPEFQQKEDQPDDRKKSPSATISKQDRNAAIITIVGIVLVGCLLIIILFLFPYPLG